MTSGNSALTMQQTGLYLVNYKVNLSSSATAPVTVVVRRNGTPIYGLMSTKTPSGNPDIYSGTALVSMSVNDTMDLAVSTQSGATLTVETGEANVTAVRIG
jgi:hypothetical protein